MGLVFAALAALVVLTSSAAGAELRGVLGIDWQWPRRALVQVDPLTLRQVGDRRVPLGDFTTLRAVSPDRALVVAAGQDEPPTLRIVDLVRWRVIRDLELAGEGGIDELEWLDTHHVAVVVRDGRSTTVFVVDVRAPEAVKSLRFRGMDVGYFRHVGDRLVALAAPRLRVGVARLLVLAPDASVRVAVLDRVEKGNRVLNGRVRHSAQPGLAVDPAARRAFAVDVDGMVAEVQLDRLSVRYHEARRAAAVTRRTKDDSTGWQIQARFERGVLLVSGYRRTMRAPFKSDGLRFIDTRTWTSRLVDRRTGSFNVVDGLVLADSGRGITAYSLDGRRRWRLDEGRRWSGAHSIARPYVYVGRTDETTAVVDLRSGRVVGVVEGSRFQPIGDHGTW